MKTREELEQMSNEQLGALYEQEVGYDPFEDNAKINPETKQPYISAHQTRQHAIQILLESEETPTPPEEWETVTLFEFCKDYELIPEVAEFEDWKNMRDELLRMTKEHIDNEE